MDLFESDQSKKQSARAPLAERMRPRNLDEFVGQKHLLGPGRILTEMADSGQLRSLVLWGPPGSGKTTLAQILASKTGARCLFVDEIHHYNNSPQDNFLPYVERGTLVLIGATTENPSFEVISPLLSRTQVLVLKTLSTEEIGAIVDRALQDSERGLGNMHLKISPEGRDFLVEHSQGDCRIALNTLETASALAHRAEVSEIGLTHVQEALQLRPLRYDKTGEEHYNVISAFIKSLRGSDPDAALYWMMRMIEAGEDPLFIARRMVIFAAEGGQGCFSFHWPAGR